MKAFEKFPKIDSISNLEEKQREWLKDYEGLNYSIALNEQHKMKWKTQPRNYYDKFFKPEINLIKEKGDRIRIEFDGNETKAKEDLQRVQNVLEGKGWGFIRSTHKGKCDYLWVEFTRELTEREKEAFLIYIAPEESEIDLNFFSSKKVFQVLYAIHWRHSQNRELPILFFEGSKIDFDSLGIKPTIKKSIQKKITKSKNFSYVTGIKEPGEIFTREGQAKEFNKLQPLFYDRSGLWWLWDNKEFKWEVVDETDILNMIHASTGKDVITPKSRQEILNALKQRGRLNIPKPIKKTWIQFQDSIMDFSTGEEFKASPEYFVTNPIPWKLHPERFVETPVMDSIFREWVGEEHIKTLHQILAYCLIPDYPVHRLFCFIGSGLNGKSCFLRLLKKFVGNTNTTATELDTLASSRFEKTRLYKKLVCIMGETNFSEINKTSILKQLTGQDTIGYEFKNKNPFEDVNYAKIIIATNNLPTTSDKTIGFYRRWCIIDFPNQFSEAKDILDDIPDEEYEILAVKCVNILKDLLEERKFHKEGTIEERTKRYEEKSNPLDKFISAYTEDSIDSHIWKWEFSKKLNEWCKENRFREISEVVIGRKMKELGFEQKQIHTSTGKTWRAWIGIKWKEQEELEVF